jgi:tRNA 2-thiouridine synthesizing protein A
VTEPRPADQGDPSSAADAGFSSEVDARGLACPMPVIELSRAVEAASVGAVIRLLATDPAAKIDVPVWCRMQRQGLRAATASDDGSWVFLVEKLR